MANTLGVGRVYVEDEKQLEYIDGIERFYDLLERKIGRDAAYYVEDLIDDLQQAKVDSGYGLGGSQPETHNASRIATPQDYFKEANTVKTQEILSLVNTVVNRFGAALQSDPDAQKLIAGLEHQLRMESAASSGNVNAARTVSAMLNKLKKSDGRTSLHYAWIDEHGNQCVCDGYRAYRFTPGNHLPLEPRPDNAGEPIQLGKIIPKEMPAKYRAIPLPAAKDVKAFIALERAKAGRKGPELLWDFGEGLPIVCAAYLLDLLNVFPDATEIFHSATPDGYCKPLFLRCERGDAVLLPVRPVKSDRKTAQYAEAYKPTPEQQAQFDREREERQRRRDERRRLLDEYTAAVRNDPEYAMSPVDFESLVNTLEPA